MPKKPIDWNKKPKKIKDKKAKVERFIVDAQENDDGSVEIAANTPRRLANGSPPAQILNPDLESALDDIATITNATS